jgi:hypothetical protein
LIDKQKYENIVLRQIYGNFSAKASSNNLRSVINGLLKFLENEKFIEPNKRESILEIQEFIEKSSQILPRFFVETQLTNAIIGKDLDIDAIVKRIKNKSKQIEFVRNISAMGESVINIIQSFSEDVKKHGGEASWEEAIERFERSYRNVSSAKSIQNEYYKFIQDQISSLDIDSLIKAVKETKMQMGADAVEPEWTKFVEAINAK